MILQVEDLAAAIARQRQQLDQLVVSARVEGHTWQQISRATGMSLEGARQRWGSM